MVAKGNGGRDIRAVLESCTSADNKEVEDDTSSGEIKDGGRGGDTGFLEVAREGGAKNRINDDASVTLSKCRVMMRSGLLCWFWLPSVAVPRTCVDAYRFNRRYGVRIYVGLGLGRACGGLGRHVLTRPRLE